MDVKALAFSAAIALLFVTANVLTKKSLEVGCEWLTVVVSGLAIVGFAAFRILCRHYGLAVASGVVDAMLTILTILVALVVFRESLSIRQCIGIAVLLVGLQLVR